MKVIAWVLGILIVGTIAMMVYSINVSESRAGYRPGLPATQLEALERKVCNSPDFTIIETSVGIYVVRHPADGARRIGLCMQATPCTWYRNLGRFELESIKQIFRPDDPDYPAAAVRYIRQR
jgi:hypothetical protein